MIVLFSGISFTAAKDIIGIAAQQDINLPFSNYITVNDGTDSKAIIRTNSTSPGAVNLGSVTINGDIVVGPGGVPSSVINSQNAFITGNVYAADQLMSFAPVIVPQELVDMASKGNLRVNNPRTVQFVSTSGKYDSLYLANSKTLIIDEPVSLYITGDIDLAPNSSIIIQGPDLDIDNDASLKIYLAGDYTGLPSTINNLTKDPSRFTIYGLDSCTSLEIKNGCNLYGTFYAPNADFQLDNSGDVYGSVAVNSFAMHNSGTFYFTDSIPEPATLLFIGLGLMFVSAKR